MPPAKDESVVPVVRSGLTPLPPKPDSPVVDPAHGVVRLFGAGTPIIGLTPALPSSNAPSGIVPPLSCGRPMLDVPAPDVDWGEAVPKLDGVVALGQPPVDVTPEAVPLSPPPSKEEPEPSDMPLPIAELEPPVVASVVQTEALFMVLLGAGLKPPGSISVAPSGIPVPLAVEPRTPSGEVAPIPGMAVVLCACVRPQLNHMVISTTNGRRI